MSRRPPAFVDDPTTGAVADDTRARVPGPRGAPPTDDPATVTLPQGPAGAAASRLVPGGRLGRLTVLERLGAGGMGEVFAAYDPKLDRRVALKVLRRGSDEDGEARLLREAKAMARVSHPNVIPVFEVGAEGGLVYVAMEHVVGVTLRKWLTKPRSLEEILAVFEAAGRGLWAAHAAGLVHRDFKPANVMVGDDGRVRVLDFGLARPTSHGPDGTATEDELSQDLGAPGLDARITRTGVAMGTPAYMAPEQIEAEGALDAKSDQFAFCVALYEALLGQPPFSGSTLTARMEQIRMGVVREPPATRKVPRALYDALLRGMSPRPSDRFPSMDALLVALRPRAPRRRALALAMGGAVTTGVVGLVAWVVLGSGDAFTPSPCADAGAPMEALWSPTRRAALEAAFVATDAAFAPAAWEGLVPRVDAYVARGAAQRVAACEATRVQGTQSTALLDRRVACLDRGRRELSALLDAWVRADAGTVAGAARAVSELPEPEACDDLDMLLGGIPLPTDVALARQVEAARERLAVLRAEEGAGHYRDALPMAEHELMVVSGVPYPPLHAEALLAAGRLWLRHNRYDDARERLERAYERGLRLRHDEVAVEAASMLALLLGENQGRTEEGLTWLRHAEALHARGGTASHGRNLLRLRALLYGQRGELDRALALHEQAVREAEAALGPDDHECAMAHYNLGNALDMAGRPDEARWHFERARAIFEALGGPKHPDVSYALHGLADVAYDAGQLEQARALYQRSYDIRLNATGTGTFMLAIDLSRLATVAVAQRRFDDAVALATRSVEIGQAELGPDSLQLGRLLNNLAMAHVGAGQLDEAEAVHARMLAIFERHLPPEHPNLVAARSNLAALRFQRGDLEGALAVMRRVLDVSELSFGPEHPKVAEALDKLGVVLVALDRPGEAIPLHRRALAIREARQGPEHLETAQTLALLAEALVDGGDAAGGEGACRRVLALEGRFEAPELMATGRFLLAQARWAQGERRAARAEAARARAAYDAIGEAEKVAAVDAWLAGR